VNEKAHAIVTVSPTLSAGTGPNVFLANICPPVSLLNVPASAIALPPQVVPKKVDIPFTVIVAKLPTLVAVPKVKVASSLAQPALAFLMALFQ